MVCANLIAPLLVAESRRMISRLSKDGVLVLAGVLAREFGAVRRAFEAVGLKLRRDHTRGEWRSASFIWHT